MGRRRVLGSAARPEDDAGTRNHSAPLPFPGMRFLPTRFHGAIDYLWGLLLLALPFALGFADGTAPQVVLAVFGAGAILYAAVTDYELGVLRLLPMRWHLLADAGAGALLAASPWLLGFADRVWLPHLAFGLFAVAASLVTRLEPADRAPRPA